jgi:hypothetical protein
VILSLKIKEQKNLSEIKQSIRRQPYIIVSFGSWPILAGVEKL